MRFKLEEPVLKICKLCGFYKCNICTITKQKKSEHNDCDVKLGNIKAFIHKGGLITKDNLSNN